MEEGCIRVKGKFDGKLNWTDVAQCHANTTRNSLEVYRTVEHLTKDSARHGLTQTGVGHDVVECLAIQVASD